MDNAPNGSSEPPPTTYDENDGIVLPMKNNIDDAEEPQAPPAASRLRRARQKAPESEQRRTQNRNAAARHRQRQQQRMSELVRKESMLKQRVSELEIEVEMLRRGRAGLKLPERDPFTASILDMLEDVSNLRASLLRYTVESQLLVEDVSRCRSDRDILTPMHYPPMNTEGGEDTNSYRDVRPTFPAESRADAGGGGGSSRRGSHTVQRRQRQGHRHHHERDSLSPSMSGEDDEEFDDDDGEDEDPGREGRRGSYSIDSRRNRQWAGDLHIAAGHASTHDALGATNRMFADDEVATRGGNSAMADHAAAAAGTGSRAQSPRSARRYRNRLAAARMRSRQKQQLVELEKRKGDLERRAAELQLELQDIQRKNNPLNSSIDKLAGMIDDLTKVECTMLTGIDECKSLLQNLEKLYESKQQKQQQQQPQQQQ